MEWKIIKQITYALLLILCIGGASFYAYTRFSTKVSTCTDGIHNGYEKGIDCGGLCARICKAEVLPIEVKWSTFFTIEKNVYDIAAMVTNKNTNATTISSLTVIYRVYDKEGNEIFTKEKQEIALTNADTPLVLSNVYLEKEPSLVTVSFVEAPYVKINEKYNAPRIQVLRTSFENGDIPRAIASIKNITQETFFDMPIRIVLYDENNIPLAIGSSYIKLLNKGGIQNVIVTWKKPFEKTPTTIRVYPIVNPLL